MSTPKHGDVGDHGHAYQTGAGGVDLDVYDVMPAFHSTASKPAAVAAGAGTYTTLSGSDHLMYSGTGAAEEVFDGFEVDDDGGVEL